MKESGKENLKPTIYDKTLSTAGAVPLPQWGRLRNEDAAILDTQPSPRGEGAPKGRRLDGDGGVKESEEDRLKCAINESTLSTADAVPLPQWGRQRGGGFAAKRKPTPPRCARQPLPREGARVDTPSFLWKEVPRRGGGWMGEAVSPTQSLPRVGKVASGAGRIGF